MDTSLAASPLFVASLLRVIALAVLGTEILLLWTSRRGPEERAHAASHQSAPLGRLMWVATPALVLIVLSLWSAASILPRAQPAAPSLALAEHVP